MATCVSMSKSVSSPTHQRYRRATRALELLRDPDGLRQVIDNGSARIAKSIRSCVDQPSPPLKPTSASILRDPDPQTQGIRTRRVEPGALGAGRSALRQDPRAAGVNIDGRGAAIYSVLVAHSPSDKNVAVHRQRPRSRTPGRSTRRWCRLPCNRRRSRRRRSRCTSSRLAGPPWRRPRPAQWESRLRRQA